MGVVALGTAGILVAAFAVAMLSARLHRQSVRWRQVGIAAGVGLVVAAVACLTGVAGIPSIFWAPVITLGLLFGVVVTIPLRELAIGGWRTVVLTLAASVLLFVPAVTIVFAGWYDPFATGLGYLDLGGGLPILIAGGTVVVTVSLIERRAPTRSPLRVRAWGAFWPALVLWAGCLAWLVGLELAFDTLTPLIVANGLLMPLAAAAAWAIVERARHRSNTAAGVALGIAAGCAAAVPAAGYEIVPLALFTGLIAGAAGALLPRGSRLHLGGTLLVGAGVSLILLGFLAQDVGFIYTGQPEVFFGQTLTVVLAVASAAVVAAVAWLILRPRGEEPKS